MSARSAATLEASLKLLMERGVLATAVARDGVLACTSPKFDDIFGMPAGAAEGKSVAQLSVEGDRERVARTLESTSMQPPDPGECVTLTFDALRADGSVFEAELRATAGLVEGGPATVLLVTDVTERRRAEKQLSYMAFLDPLTGLPNRALLLDRLRDTLQAARSDGRVFAVLMCDLDGFKRVNDTLGHEAGDVLLQTVARRLEGAVRGSDTVARQGGDEFVVLLARVASRADAALAAERVVRALDAPVEVAGTPCKVGVSVGIAAYPDDGDHLDALLARADFAMYESKRAGKNRYTFAPSVASDAAPARIAFFQLGPAHEVGVQMVDAQHRQVVHLMNRLGEDLKAGRGREAVLASLRALVSFTLKHFDSEERLMASHPGCPLAAAHGQEHRKLHAELASLTVDLEVKSMMLTVRFLQDWLLRHLETMDRPMALWLREQGVS